MKVLQTSVPLREWPPAEQEKWRAATNPPRNRAERRDTHTWDQQTQKTVLSAYSLSLGWLRDRGLLDWRVSPAQRWPTDRLCDYDAHLEAVYAKNSHKTRLRGLERGLHAIDPNGDRAPLQAILRALGGSRAPARDATRLPAPHKLCQLGLHLMDLANATSAPLSAMDRATLAREGFQLVVWAETTLRSKDFRELDLNNSERPGVHRRSAGPQATRGVLERDARGLWRVQVVPSKTKRFSMIPQIFDFSADIQPRIDSFIGVHRPVLVRNCPNEVALWVKSGKRENRQSITRALARIAFEYFRVHLTPQGVRQSEVTHTALSRPIAMKVASKKLGHGPLQTTTEWYNSLDSVSASRAFNDFFEEIRSAYLKQHKL